MKRTTAALGISGLVWATNLPANAQAYVRAVAHFARHYRCSPEQLSGEQVRRYLLYLVQERKVSWSLYNQTRCALQFFYRVTLGRDEWFDKLPCAKRPRRLLETIVRAPA